MQRSRGRTALFKGYGTFRTQGNWGIAGEGRRVGHQVELLTGQSREGLAGGAEQSKGAPRPRPVPRGPKIT